MSPLPISVRNFVLAIDARPIEVKSVGKLAGRGVQLPSKQPRKMPRYVARVRHTII